MLKRLKLNITLALFAGLVCAVAAQAQSRAVIPNFLDPQDRFEQPDLADLARLRFLTVTDFPPFSYVDENRALAGYHVELAREICERLGVEARCEIQALPFAELEKALADGEGEAIIAGIAITPQSRERLAFTRPYFRLPARFAAPVGSFKGELDALSGRTIAARRGTAHAAYVERFFPGTKLLTFETAAEATEAVRKGEADLLFADALGLARRMTGAELAGWTFVGGAYTDPAYFGRGLAIAVKPDDPDLLDALNYALVALNESRTLEELYLRHFPIGLF